MNIGEMQRKLSLWAEQDKGRKFYGLFDLVCNVDWLRLAHDYVAQNAGSKTAGCDGLVMSDFDQDTEGNLRALRESLQSDQFEACPVRRVYIPKANGKVRPLGIPSIRDRIVQEAVRMILEPIFEADFDQHSFGFRPNRCTMDAVSYLLVCAKESMKYFWAIEGDISAYFDTICHRRLVKLLRRRVEDERLLDLIWKFLRSGVMERKLFKDTTLGTPQGGIVSPLLANVYLHELDKFMARYTDLSETERSRRRKRGQANFVYVRYADDFVALCNGTEAQALEMRKEVHDYLRDHLHLTLSLEKTKVTHLNDGLDFLGFRLKRGLGGRGMVTKITIPDKAMEKHRSVLRAATAPNTHEDSIRTKLLALNRIIGGWCRYYQWTGKVGLQFAKMTMEAFWLFAHWLGRKHKLQMPEVLARFYSVRVKGDAKTLGVEKLWLVRHSSFKARRYFVSPFKPNPYTTQARLEREELLDDDPWLGTECRPGMADLRPVVLERDGHKCCVCKEAVTKETAQVDHVRPVCTFKRPVDANRLENLWTLCVPCHKRKTEMDRQRESRVH
jgi:group II intron reverse transcriptase/maturase